LRLPPKGYREKIWDQAPGTHFITEAGGKVTDLEGRMLDFSKGRYLNESVTGIVASNSHIHKKLLDSILLVKGV
jgi:3'-phosphoadenosine 5'-phosphosulfate (PAPS) 3'-phosphatase